MACGFDERPNEPEFAVCAIGDRRAYCPPGVKNATCVFWNAGSASQ
jgi:hypothetical protein